MNFTLRNQNGITLIEVIVVMAMIGLLAALAIPASWMREPTELAVEGAARELASNLQLAREWAMRDGVSYHVYIYPGTSSYSINKGKPSSSTVIKSFSLNNRVVFGTGGTIPVSYVRYSRDGHSFQNGTIELIDTGGKFSRKIRVTVYGSVYYIE